MDTLDDAGRAAVDEGVSYLAEFGRGAALPDVRHRIQGSKHFPDMSEVRADLDSGELYRELFCFDEDGVPVLLVGGDKSGDPDAWYDKAIPIADGLFDTFVELERTAKEMRDG